MVLRNMVSYSWVCLLSFPVCYHKPLYPSVFSFQIMPSFLGTNDADMHFWKNLNVFLFLVVKYFSYISSSNMLYRSVKLVSLWSVDSGHFRSIFLSIMWLHCGCKSVLQDIMRLELLTIHGGEHQGTRLHPYQIISLSAHATDAVRIMNTQATWNFPWEPILVIKS